MSSRQTYDIPEPVRVRLHHLKVLTRWMTGAVWILEGWGPKIWAVTPEGLELVERMGLWVVSPAWTLAGLGMAEIFGGLWLLTGLAERTAAVLAVFVGCLLGVIVVIFDPAALVDTYGGVVKDLWLIPCGAVIWTLAPLTSGSGRLGAEVRTP